jgi:hypothetical protein
MDRRLIVLIMGLVAVMAAGAAIVVAGRPVEHLPTLVGHLGTGRRPLPIEALFAAPAGLLLNVFFVALRQPGGDSASAAQRRRWSATLLMGVAGLFAALEAIEIGVIYGWFSPSESLPRILLAAAAIWMVMAANGAAKLIVLGRTDAPASSRRLALNRFGALIGLAIGACLVPVSLWAPLSDALTIWLLAPLALGRVFTGRVVIAALDARSVK